MSNKTFSWQDTIKDMRKCIYSEYTVNPKYRAEQTRFDRRIIPAVVVALLVPMLIFPIMIAGQWNVIAKTVIVACWLLYPGITITYALIRKKRITNGQLGVKIGDEKIRITRLNTPEDLDFIYHTNGNVFQILQEPDEEFINIMYNWYRNMNILRDDMLHLYVADARMFEEKFHGYMLDVDVFTTVVGVFCKDLDVHSEKDFAILTNSGLNLFTVQGGGKRTDTGNDNNL